MRSYKPALFVLLAFVACSFTACYPEGGGKLVNPEYQIVNLWSVSRAYYDNVQVDTSTFDTDDIYYQGYMPSTLYYIYADHVMNVLRSYHGQIRQSTFSTWVIDKSSNTLTLKFTLLGRYYQVVAEIRKLSKRELIIEFDEDGHHWRLELYAQTNY